MLQEILDKELKVAILQKNNDTKNYIRNIKSRVSEHCVENKIDRSAKIEDAVIISVISIHKKSLEKAVEMLKSNEKAGDLINEYKKEITFCNRFLPTNDNINEFITTEVVKYIKENNISDEKQCGKIVGIIMKKCKENGYPSDGSQIKNIVLDQLKREGD